MSPADKGGHRNVKMQAAALVPKPSRELRSLLPLMEWDPLPPLEDTVACEGTSSDLDSEDGHGTADDLTPNAGMHGGIKPAPWSLLNPEPRQVSPVLVKSKRELARAAGLCRKAKAIALDCEGCNLSAEGRLCLVQVLVPVSAADAKSGKGYRPDRTT